MAHRHVSICDECQTERVVSRQGTDDDRPTHENDNWYLARPPLAEQMGCEVATDMRARLFCSLECAKRWLHKRVDALTPGKPIRRPGDQS